MTRSSTPFFLLAVLTFGCSGEKAPAAAPPTPAGRATSTVAAPAPAAGGGEIGIPACDEFIRKYEACVRDHVPAAQKQATEQALEQWRASWRMAAAQPAARASLASSCQQTLTTARASMSAYGCQW